MASSESLFDTLYHHYVIIRMKCWSKYFYVYFLTKYVNVVREDYAGMDMSGVEMIAI